MKIQEFHSQLADNAHNDALMTSLRRLSAETVTTVVKKPVVPLSDWGVWDTGAK